MSLNSILCLSVPARRRKIKHFASFSCYLGTNTQKCIESVCKCFLDRLLTRIPRCAQCLRHPSLLNVSGLEKERER